MSNPAEPLGGSVGVSGDDAAASRPNGAVPNVVPDDQSSDDASSDLYSDSTESTETVVLGAVLFQCVRAVNGSCVFFSI